jgi:Rrf2 family nitric oxide-sensitive transcriptional repressor
MFSQTVEYALRAVVHLAYCSPSASTTEQIAIATKVPQAYLSKVLQGLSRAGVVRSQRGIGGGVALALPPGQLTILDVVNAVDPIQRIHQCPLGLPSHGRTLCPLHKRVDDALCMVEEAFRKTTLAEILAEPSSSKPLCEVQAAMDILAAKTAAPPPATSPNDPSA